VAVRWGIRGFKVGFFDPTKLLAAADRLEARAQSRFGAFVRRRMKSSIKYRAAAESAGPGQPPFAHRSAGFTRAKKNRKTGKSQKQAQSPLRELIYFARDPRTRSVVIGPAAFGSRVARTIEKGGTGFRTDPRTGRKESATFAPHPFAEPAGRAEAAKFPELLRTLVR
jgi:hypothetical protein